RAGALSSDGASRHISGVRRELFDQIEGVQPLTIVNGSRYRPVARLRLRLSRERGVCGKWLAAYLGVDRYDVPKSIRELTQVGRILCTHAECAICRERRLVAHVRAELRQSSDSRPRRHRSLTLAGTPRCAAVYRCRWPALTRRERYSGCRLTALPKVDVRIANSTPSAMRRGRSPVPRTPASPPRGSPPVTLRRYLT